MSECCNTCVAGLKHQNANSAATNGRSCVCSPALWMEHSSGACHTTQHPCCPTVFRQLRHATSHMSDECVSPNPTLLPSHATTHAECFLTRPVDGIQLGRLVAVPPAAAMAATTARATPRCMRGAEAGSDAGEKMGLQLCK